MEEIGFCLFLYVTVSAFFSMSRYVISQSAGNHFYRFRNRILGGRGPLTANHLTYFKKTFFDLGLAKSMPMNCTSGGTLL